MSNEKFGYRKVKPTVDANTRLLEMVVSGLYNRNMTFIVFFDLSKAFDCVELNLTSSLTDYVGHSLPHRWLKSFIYGR